MNTNLNPPTELLESYLYANTAPYFFRAIVNSSYLDTLRRVSHDQLRSIAELKSESPASLDSVVNAYCALVALLCNPQVRPGETEVLISNSRLPWASAFRSLSESMISASTSTFTLTMPSVRQVADQQLPTSISTPSMTTEKVSVSL